MWRWIVGAMIVLAIGFVVRQQLVQRGRVVDIATVESGEIKSYVEEQAKTRVPEVFEITMPLQGRILPIKLREGDQVEKGQVVAEMEVDDLDTSVIKKKSQVDRLVQAFAALENRRKANELQVAAAKAKFDFAKSQFDRQQRLWEDKATSETNFENAQSQRIQAESDLRENELEVANTMLWEAALKLMEVEYDEELDQANRDRKRAEIHSTASGTVLSRTVSNEKVLSAGSVLLQIGDLSQLEIEADVLTQEVVRVKIGDPVTIEGPSLGEGVLTGQVTRIFPQGFTKVSSLGVEQQRVKVVIGFNTSALAQLQKEQRVLGVDYRLRVKIFTDEKTDALKVPRAAVFRNGTGQWQVYAVEKGRAKLKTVEIGLANDFELEIRSGLIAGAQIIIAPPAELREGDAVRSAPIAD
jgi:HlyD family secretion protein